MSMHNLLSMPHLPTRKTKGKEPLVDYFQSHVITYDQYFDVMWKKAMDNAITKEIKKHRRKEREEKRLKRSRCGVCNGSSGSKK